MRVTPLLLVSAAFGWLAACDVSVPGLDGGRTCLDDFLADLGKDRSGIEAEAEAAGIDAATLVESLALAEGLTDAVIDCSASGPLEGLADRTGGDAKRSASGDEAAGTLIDQAGAQPAGSDLVVLLDASCSMQDDLDAVRDRLDELLAEAGDDARAGLVLYRDRNVDADWYVVESDLVPATSPALDAALEGVVASGGGDIPESLYDAVTRVLETQTWKSDDRSILVLTDAGPLEGDLTDATEDSTVALAKEKGVEVSTVQVELW